MFKKADAVWVRRRVHNLLSNSVAAIYGNSCPALMLLSSLPST
jgi:hypothetical protein